MKYALGKDIALAVIFALAVAGAWFYFSPGTLMEGGVSNPALASVHHHAGFRVYVDGALQDYSGFEYMTVTPCGPEDIHAGDTVHLHNSVSNVIHVHASGVIWNDAFDYINSKAPLGYSIEEKGIVGYVNGQKIDDILSHPINSYDSVVIFVGSVRNTKSALEDAVTVDDIKKAEASNEGCGLEN